MADVANLKCPEHPELTFLNPQAFGAHNRHVHPGRAKSRGESLAGGDEPSRVQRPRKAKARKTSRRPARVSKTGSGVMAEILDTLRARRSLRIDHLIDNDPEVRELDAALKALGAPSPT